MGLLGWRLWFGERKLTGEWFDEVVGVMSGWVLGVLHTCEGSIWEISCVRGIEGSIRGISSVNEI